MVIGALAGAAVGGLGAFLQYRAQQQANQIAYANLQFQRENAHEQNKLARSARTDVFGNRLKYVPGRGWVYDLTPQTQAITTAQQKEQLLNLTEDAERNREFRERQDEISKVGSEEFFKALNNYKFAPRPNEKAIQGDFTRLLNLNRRKGIDEAKGVLQRQALRLGRGGDIEKIIKEGDERFGETLEEAVLRGKTLGSQEFRTQSNFIENLLSGEVDRFSAMANRFDPAQVRRSQTPDDLNALQGEMLQSMARALASEGDQVGAAFSQLSRTAGSTAPNLGPVAAALSRIGGGRGRQPSFSAPVVAPVGGAGLSYTPSNRGVGDTGYSGASNNNSLLIGDEYFQNWFDPFD